jgi:hypothetical protein
LKDLKARTFTATGTSIAADKIAGIRPVGAGDAWSSVSDDLRSQAVNAAREDAAQRIIESIRAVPVTSDKTVDDLLSRQSVRGAFDRWLRSRPVTQVRFREDLEVELRVSAPPDELVNALVTCARAENGSAVQIDDTAVETLKQEFSRRISGTIGRGGISATQPAEAAPGFEFPRQPPAWVFQALEAEGVASRGLSPLRTKTAAEAKATDNLQLRIAALPLTHRVTIDEAAKMDPRYGSAVNNALLRARVDKAEPRADGSYLVRIKIDAQDLWIELRSASRR